MRLALALTLALLGSASAVAQPILVPIPVPASAPTPAPAWGYPPLTAGAPPAEPVPSGVPVRPDETVSALPAEPTLPPAAGQQHWVAVQLLVFQPFVGRVQVKVWPRANGSLWVEAFAGSVLFDGMYGFGLRAQYTALQGSRGDALLISPGVGVHILPNWESESREVRYYPYTDQPYRAYVYRYTSLYYAAFDVDVSWLHDFGPHFGYELGMKFGLAGRMAGHVGNSYPRSVMFGRDLYPIFSVYSGFRF